MSEQYTNKHYCCLYHFTSGKKEKSSTACNNHVQLGVINPIHLTVSRSSRSPPDNLVVETKKHEINFPTHDLNSIQNKKSLPKRLGYPRVYVQQINPKNKYHALNTLAHYEAFTKKKQFQQIFLMFKKFAKLTNFKSEEEIIKAIKANYRHRSISTFFPASSKQIPQYFYSRHQFISFLVELGFESEEAEQFWRIAFNKSRFEAIGQKNIKSMDEVISMSAFAYNYKKFYLDQMQSFSNCLSSTALRQRMIDLRLFLQPWFTSNIVFKENYKTWKVIELQICSKLSDLKQEDLYMKMIETIEMRNKIWLFMRTLAKIFYVFTDQKNIGLDIFNQKATTLITNTKQHLEVFVNFVAIFQTYLLENDKSKNDLFKITDLVQFAKKNFNSNTDKIVNYLRGLFKYLYFFNKSDLLHLNIQTFNLDCTGIAEITYNDLLEFISYKQEEKDHFIETISSICTEINETVSARPEISGHKRFITQCNYLAESLLKMIKRCNFSVFYCLELARRLFINNKIQDLSSLKQVLERTDIEDQDISKQFWKKTFMFISKQEPHSFLETETNQNGFNHFQQALLSYKGLQQKMQGKYPKVQEKSKQGKEMMNNGALSQQQNINGKKVSSNAISIKIDTNVRCHSGPGYCTLCDSLCSTEIETSLNKIDQMSSYLMNLLQDI